VRTSYLSPNLAISAPDTKSLHKTRTLPRTTNVPVTVLNGPLVFRIPLEDVLIWN